MAQSIFMTDLVKESCCNCGITFAFPADFYSQCKDDVNKWFFCPNGHKQHYIESESTRLKKALDRERENSGFYQKRLNETAKDRDAAIRNLKGTKTRMRNLKTRIANGVCPCCNRQFTNLHRHMSHMHPAYKPEAE